MPTPKDRSELADFLKGRRARLSPKDLGFPLGHGRRTPGLRREEVAAAAGVGLTWYTSLEQGKSIQVSTKFLERIARALQLNDTERRHLFGLAQRRAERSTIAAPIDARRLNTILAAIECPAYARNNRFDVLAWNAANTRWFGDFAAIPSAERNVVRLMFTRSYHKRSMPRWVEDARALLAKFRLALGQAEDADVFQSLIADLEANSPDFRRMWAEHEVSDVGEGVTQLSSPKLGEVLFQHQTLTPEGMPDMRVVMFIPVGGAVAAERSAKLGLNARRSGEERLSRRAPSHSGEG